MKITALLALAVLAAPLAACADADLLAEEGTPSPQFGVAQRHNLAAQIANPDAPAADGQQTMDGQRAALALDRYKEGKVIKPADVLIGEVGSSGSGTGGSGGGETK
jgi:type IV pilus biogenesis protein CpaD/CtpE